MYSGPPTNWNASLIAEEKRTVASDGHNPVLLPSELTSRTEQSDY